MPNCYSESHHIIPKSIGGKDKRTNKTYVSAREHFILHWLLTKMCVNTQHKFKMLEAFSMFSNNEKRKLKFTSRQSASLQEANAAASQERNKGNTAWKCRGELKESSRKSMSDISSQSRWINNGHKESFAADHEERTKSGWEYGRVKRTSVWKRTKSTSEETKQLLSIASKKALTGKKKSKTHIENMRKQMLSAESLYCEYCFKTTKKFIYSVHHGIHFKKNPNRSIEQIERENLAREKQEIIQCPYCSFQSLSLQNMKRWHFDNCKNINRIEE